MARSSISDFISAVEALGFGVRTNADGSLKITGAKNFSSVFWNISNGGVSGGNPGEASSNGSTPNTTSTGLCQVVYSDRPPYNNDTCTIQPDGSSGSGAYTIRADDFLAQL